MGLLTDGILIGEEHAIVLKYLGHVGIGRKTGDVIAGAALGHGVDHLGDGVPGALSVLHGHRHRQPVHCQIFHRERGFQLQGFIVLPIHAELCRVKVHWREGGGEQRRAAHPFKGPPQML